MTAEGVPLAGGNVNAPVRFGDRVHRVAGPWTPAVHAYLRYVRAHGGADLVPEPFGFDAEGREVLAFLPGDVPAYPLPDPVWADGFLAEAARLLRVLHDASVGFDPSGLIWQQPARDPAEVISVNDYAPYNLVVVDGRITGVIDLDQASPGPRVRDLAHLAHRLVPLSAPGSADGRDLPAVERWRRLDLLVGEYAGPSAQDVLAAVPDVLRFLVGHATGIGRPGDADLYRADAVWLRGSFHR